ncbi:hypothetical protein LJC45_05385 [Alistipes sp. OttesenSCG-928-B03]|nr:hypothetical protein [Alistipes sp. OttesenSCG-928-B03]
MIWIYFAGCILLSTNFSWLIKGLSDGIFWTLFTVVFVMLVHAFHLVFKYYTPQSIRHIAIDNDDNMTLVFYAVQNPDTKSHDRELRKNSIRIIVKANSMKLLRNDNVIARVYKDTIRDKEDWDWLINYFAN